MKLEEAIRDNKIWKKKVVMETNLMNVLVLYGNISFALEHPENIGISSQIVRDIKKQLEKIMEHYDIEPPEGGWDAEVKRGVMLP